MAFQADPPHVILIAGPNGAGKSTVAPRLFGTLGITEFVNADVIAAGLCAFEPESVALEAGRVMLGRLRRLAEERANFAFETTLASRTFAPWLAGLVHSGYAFDLFFLWLPTADEAVLRVAQRVARGGHHVPDETVRRRYDRGLSNFFKLYRPLATTWKFYDNSWPLGPRLIAKGESNNVESVVDEGLWSKITARFQ